MGRRTLCTAALAKKAEGFKLKGWPDAWCAEAMGISAQTFVSWKNRGAEGEQPFAAFLEAYARGRQKWRDTLLKRVADDAADLESRTSTGNARWLLEKLEPEIFGNRVPEVAVTVATSAVDVNPADATHTLRVIRSGEKGTP